MDTSVPLASSSCAHRYSRTGDGDPSWPTGQVNWLRGLQLSKTEGGLYMFSGPGARMVSKVLVLAAVIGAGLTAPRVAVARTVGGSSIRYIAVHAIVSQTAVYGKSLIWTQTVPPRHGNNVPESLYWSSLTSFIPHRVFTFVTGTVVLELQISRDWIMAALSGARGSTLWAFNRITHHLRVVDFRSTTSGWSEQSFGLVNDTAVFVLSRSRSGSISSGVEVHTVMLPNGRNRIVLRRTLRCGELSMSSISVVAWVGSVSGACGKNDAFRMDPVTHHFSLLTSNHHSLDAFTNGAYTGWLHYRPVPESGYPRGRVVLLDSTTGRQTVISHAHPGFPANCRAGQNGLDDQCAQLPGITSNLVYWENGLGNLTALDLTTRREYVLQATRVPSLGGFGQGFAHTMVGASNDTQPVPGRPRSWIGIAYVP